MPENNFAICLAKLGTENGNQPESTEIQADLSAHKKAALINEKGGFLGKNLKWAGLDSNQRRLTPTGLQPVQENTQELTDKALTENKQADFAIYLATLLQEHPELEQILAAWTALPDHIKQTIQTLVGSVAIAGNDNVSK